MFGDIGAPELLIILVLVIVLFGAGRVGGLGKDLGSSIKEFRKAIKDEEPEGSATSQAVAAPPTIAPAASQPQLPQAYGAEAQQPAVPQANNGNTRPPALF